MMLKDIVIVFVALVVVTLIVGSIIRYVKGEIAYRKWRKGLDD